MHVLPKTTIKVPHLLVAKHQCDCADLHRRKCAQKQFCKRETSLHLTLPRRLPVCADKVPLQCLHLYSKLSSNRSNAECDVTMICKDEMVQKPRWITEQAAMNDVLLRRPKSTYLRDDFLFHCRKLLGTRARHGSFLKAEIQQGPVAIERQGPQRYGQSWALMLVGCFRSRASPWSADRRDSVDRSTPIGTCFECLDAASQNLLVRKQETCSKASCNWGVWCTASYRPSGTSGALIGTFPFHLQRPAPRHRGPLATKTGEYRAKCARR